MYTRSMIDMGDAFAPRICECMVCMGARVRTHKDEIDASAPALVHAGRTRIVSMLAAIVVTSMNGGSHCVPLRDTR